MSYQSCLNCCLNFYLQLAFVAMHIIRFTCGSKLRRGCIISETGHLNGQNNHVHCCIPQFSNFRIALFDNDMPSFSTSSSSKLYISVSWFCLSYIYLILKAYKLPLLWLHGFHLLYPLSSPSNWKSINTEGIAWNWKDCYLHFSSLLKSFLLRPYWVLNIFYSTGQAVKTLEVGFCTTK